MKICDTYVVDIFVGCKNVEKNTIHSEQEVFDICQSYCDKNNICVSVFPCHYFYLSGKEPGFMVKIINYPRFSETPKRLLGIAFDLAELLKKSLEQNRVSVVTPDKTYMLEEHE